MTYNSVVLADSPKHYITFDQTGTLTDSGSNSATLTVTGGVAQTTGAISGGKAETFNGTSQTIGIGNSFDFAATAAWSFEAWFKTTDTTAVKEIIRKDGGGRAYLLRLNGQNVEWYCNVASDVTTTGTNYADGQWHHVVGTYSSGTTKLYIDSTLVGTATGNAGTQATVTTYIGSSGGTGEWFNGTLDEVAIYPTALTQTQVTNHYNAGAAANITAAAPPMTLSLTAVAPAFVGQILSDTVAAPAMTLSVTTPNASFSVTKLVTTTYAVTEDRSAGTVFESDYNRTETTIPLYDGGNTSDKYALFKFQAISGAIGTVHWCVTVDGPSLVSLNAITGAWSESGTNLPTTSVSGAFSTNLVAGLNQIDVTNLVKVPGFNGIMLSNTNGSSSLAFNVDSKESANPSYLSMDSQVDNSIKSISTTPPAMTLTLSAPAPMVIAGTGVTETIPALALSLAMADATVGTNVTDAAPPMILSLSLPGGVPALPDYLATPPAISAGLSAPDASVDVEYPATISAPPMVLSLDMAYAPTIDLTTNVLKVAPVMGMSLDMVGIFDSAHDRYFNAVIPTLDADDIWYKLDETSGSVVNDSSVDTVNAGNWVQNGTYYGSFAAINDGPQLRKGVHFDGSTSYMRVGPYAINNSDAMTGNTVQANDISATMAMTVEFSIRTTQTDGVVFIGTGGQDAIVASTSPTAFIGPNVNGNELRLEAGQLVFYNAAGQKVKVRKTISDGQWHHIVVSIPQFQSGGGVALDPTQPSFVSVDGDHALVRYGTFLGDTKGYGGYWLPYTVMARAAANNTNPNGFLAGDLSNFIVRLNTYTTREGAASLYYEWSDANVIHPTPATLTVSTVTPFKVKGSIKKMLALYGLGFVQGHGAPAVGQLGPELYQYFDVLSGMIIQNLGNNINIPTAQSGERFWEPPQSFMMDDYLVVPVSIFGNLYNNDNYAISTPGTINPDSTVTPNGIFVDDETGHPRFINLQQDLTVDVTEEFDVITMVNYPWEKPNDPSVGELNYTIPYHGFGDMTDDQWTQARDNLRDSVMEAVYSGCSMWIGDYYVAQHFGFIQGYDVHDFDRWQGISQGSLGVFEFNQHAQDIDNQHLSTGNKSNIIGTGHGDYKSYPQANFYRRITALVPGLTDLPGNDYAEWVEGWNVDDFLPNGNFVAYDILRRPNGLQLGDQVSMEMLYKGSKFYGETSGVTELSFPNRRVSITSARPEGVCGTIVSREQESYYGIGGEVVENPYKDNVLTIAAEQGTVVNGRPIGGRVFIELMSTNWGRGYIGEDTNKNRWHGNDGLAIGDTSSWDFDSRRELELKNTITTQSWQRNKSGGYDLITKIAYFFVYSDEATTYNLYLPMAYRGLYWLSQTPELVPGEARVYSPAMQLTLTEPNAVVSQTASPAAQVVGPMRLNLALVQPANYADGNVEIDVFGGIELSLEMRGLGRVVSVPPMSLAVTTVAPKLSVQTDQLTVYIDGDRNITLFLKEDN